MPVVLAWAISTGFLARLPEVSVAWSPDQSWVAYTIATRPAEGALDPLWLFENPRLTGPASPPPATTPAVTYRLWATRVDSRESTLLAEAEHPLTAPAWHPDGSSLAFGRLVVPDAGPPRLEVVIQNAPDRSSVLTSWEIKSDRARDPETIASARVSWSPDGRFLAVPQLDPAGLALIRVDNGHVLRVLEGAFSASWSNDGSHLAYFGPDGLYWINANAGDPRRLVVLANTDLLPPAFWSADGETLVALLRGASFRGWPGRFGPGFGNGPERLDIIRVWIDAKNRPDRLQSLDLDPFMDPETLLSTSFVQNSVGDQIFYTTVVRGQQNQIVWYFPRDRAIRSRFNPIDPAVALGALSVPSATDASLLAFRAENEGLASVVGLCDPLTQRVTPLVPDDTARVEWLGLLLRTARAILAENPARTADGKPLDRVSLLPAPAELGVQAPMVSSLRHLARIGRPLCDRPANSPSPDPTVQMLLDQARLFFDYLDVDFEHPTKNYELARADLDAVEETTTHPEARLRLLCLRAQVELGRGETQQAQALLDYLVELRPGSARHIEETADGFHVALQDDTIGPWIGFLRAAPSPGSGPPSVPGRTNPLGNVNFDAPKPGLGLDPLPIPQRGLRPRFGDDRIDEIEILPRPR